MARERITHGALMHHELMGRLSRSVHVLVFFSLDLARSRGGTENGRVLRKLGLKQVSHPLQRPDVQANVLVQNLCCGFIGRKQLSSNSTGHSNTAIWLTLRYVLQLAGLHQSLGLSDSFEPVAYVVKYLGNELDHVCRHLLRGRDIQNGRTSMIDMNLIMSVVWCCFEVTQIPYCTWQCRRQYIPVRELDVPAVCRLCFRTLS